MSADEQMVGSATGWELSRMSMSTMSKVVGDGLRTQLWPTPTLGVVLALGLGVGLPRLDARIDDGLPNSVSLYLFGGGADAARTVLSSVAGSLITVTSLTFSLTVLTLQLASSQFSPRLLRTFSRDRFVHVTLALFVATFTYALTVLRTVRTAGEGRQVFVPQISVTVAFALALASVAALVLFLSHLAQEIRVEAMLRNVHHDASATARRLLPARNDAGRGTAIPPRPPTARPLLAASSGFLVRVDQEAILAAAVDADATVVIDRTTGSSLVAGTPVGAGWPRTGVVFEADTWSRLAERVAKAVLTGFERTAAQDVGFGLRQITDVVIKALSPGINDPTTAVHALGHSSALLCELAVLDMGPGLLCDEHGEVRVVLARPDLADLLELAVAQPRRYGATDPAVLGRLTSLLCEIAWVVPQLEQRRAVADQLARIQATAAEQDFDATERSHLDVLADQAQQALTQRGTPEATTA